MKIKPFALERYFAQYEFSANYLLSSSDCDGLLMQTIVDSADAEARALWENLQLGYTESLGNPLLREEASKLYQSITSDQLLIVAPEEGILIALQSILEPGDHVICTFPGYQSLYTIAESLGCEVTRWLPQESNGWHFDPADVERQIRPNTKLIVINFPHNPTGFLPAQTTYAQIINLARAHNLYLFSDEMYRFLEHDAADRLESACDLYENAVSLFGMSKTFGMAGVRIGWLATKNQELYTQFATRKDFTTICSSAPSEILSIIVLRAKDRFIAEHLHKIDVNLAVLDGFMCRNSELFSWTKPSAGTIGFPKLHIELSSYDFCEKVVKEAGIMLLPSTVYDFGERHFRVGFGRKNMPAVLEIFEDYLQKQFR